MPSSASEVQGKRKTGRRRSTRIHTKIIVIPLPRKKHREHFSVSFKYFFPLPIENYPFLFTHSQASETHRNGFKFWIKHFMNGIIWGKSFSLV